MSQDIFITSKGLEFILNHFDKNENICANSTERNNLKKIFVLYNDNLKLVSQIRKDL